MSARESPSLFQFYLTGKFERGDVKLVGTAVNYWPEKWSVGKGVWWNKEGYRTWGRATIRWTGTVTINGREVKVDAYGIGEFTRYSEKTAQTGGEWGRWQPEE